MPPIKDEQEETSALPTPTPLAALQLLDPIPSLLLSFPVPELDIPTRPVPFDVAPDTSRWSTDSLERMAEGMAASAGALIRSGQFSRFLREQMHREAQQSLPATAAESGAALSTPAAVAYLDRSVTTAVKKHLSTSAQTSTIERSTALATSGSSGRWVRTPAERGMVLRPRQQDGASTPAPEAHVKGSTKAPSTEAPREVKMEEEEDVEGVRMDDLNSLFVLDLITGARPCTPSTLHQFIAMTPILPQPFRAVPMKTLTHFLSDLMQDVVASSTGEATDRIWTEVLRGLAAITCLAHPSFDATATPDGLVDHLVTVLNTATRQVGQTLTHQDTKLTTAPARNAGEAVKVVDALDASAIAWMHLLRSYLQRFAVILCHRTLNLISDTDLVRLEDIFYQCIFSVAHRKGEAIFLAYSSYVMDSAVHAYRCLWNRLEVQRTVTAERFFQRMLLSPQLTLRTMVSEDGRKLMPLTLAVLSAAQSTPVYADTVSHRQAERLEKQCTIWSSCLIQQLLEGQPSDEKEPLDTAWQLFSQVLEDLTALIGDPEWPAADMLLHTSILALSRRYLQKPGTSREGATVQNTVAVLALDIVAQVTLSLLEAVAAEEGSTGSRTALEALHREVEANPALIQSWQAMLAPSLAKRESELRRREESTAIAVAPPRRSSHHEAAEIPQSSQLLGMLYYATSDLMEKNAAAVDRASLWFHVRTAQLYYWHLHDELIPEHALDTLVRATAVPHHGVTPLESSWKVMRSWTRVLLSQTDKSMLSSSMQRTLLAVLLSVFKVREGQAGETLGVHELVLRKALQHLSRLLSVFPPLQKVVWPIARQCIRDESARVRESSISLLMALLGCTTNCPTSGDDLHLKEANLAADIVSSLLHLLEDKSIAVATRTVAALDVLLTDRQYQHLFMSEKGGNLRSFAQFKLLSLITPGGERRPRSEVAKLFLKRWIVCLRAKDGSDNGGVSPTVQVANEISTLTVLGAPDYPHEASSNHLLVHLLLSMCRQASVAEVSSRRRGKHVIEVAQVHHGMRSAARALWSQYQASTTAEEAVPFLAALHVLSLVCAEWVEPLVEGLFRCLEYPPPPTSAQRAHTEFAGGTILLACHIFHSVLSSPRVPTISLDALSRTLIALLANYVGQYQQRIILASCKALSALITCGAEASSQNQTYLILCYALMNTYYVRAKSLLPQMHGSANNVLYIQRFLFLLSQLLRCYEGWRSPPALLQEESVTRAFGATPNQLALGDGICANVYALVTEALQQCDEAAKPKVSLVALRVLASLCMLEPSVFLYHSEPYLREALQPGGDPAPHVHGLSLIRDFLVEEDRRVEEAAKLLTLHDGTKGDDEEEEERTPRRLVGLRPAARPASKRYPPRAPAPPAAVPEQNSGMATWVMQKLHHEVLSLSGSGHVSVRGVCLEILQLVAQGGLLPPVKYLDAVMALAVDRHPPLQQRAVQLLSSHMGCLEVMTSLASRGVQLSYKLHHACGVNLLQSAYSITGREPFGVETSVHAPLFQMINKRQRESVLVALVRFFCQDAKATAWCTEFYPPESRVARPTPLHLLSDRNPLTFLAHLAAVVVLCPFAHESEVVHLMQQCRSGIDLHGQSTLDTITDLLQGGQPLRDGDPISLPPLELPILWRAVGVITLAHMRRALRAEYRLTPAKLRRYLRAGAGSGGVTAPLPRREPKSKAIVVFLDALVHIVQRMSCLLTCCCTPNPNSGSMDNTDGGVPEVWEGLSLLQTELEAVLLEEGADDVFGEQRAKAADSGAAILKRRRGRSSTAGKQTIKHRRHSDSSSASDAEDAATSSDVDRCDPSTPESITDSD